MKITVSAKDDFMSVNSFLSSLRSLLEIANITHINDGAVLRIPDDQYRLIADTDDSVIISGEVNP